MDRLLKQAKDEEKAKKLEMAHRKKEIENEKR